jgi:hypothetical protein
MEALPLPSPVGAQAVNGVKKDHSNNAKAVKKAAHSDSARSVKKAESPRSPESADDGGRSVHFKMEEHSARSAKNEEDSGSVQLGNGNLSSDKTSPVDVQNVAVGLPKKLSAATYAAAIEDDFQQPLRVPSKSEMPSTQAGFAIASFFGVGYRIPLFAAVVACWISIGMILLCSQEKMEFITALYVLAQIVTTIGYGDVAVQSTDGMKAFLSFYALCCIVGVAGIIHAACNYLVHKSQSNMGQRLNRLRNSSQEEAKPVRVAKSVFVARSMAARITAFAPFGRKDSKSKHKTAGELELEKQKEKGDIKSCEKRLAFVISGLYVVLVLLVGMIFYGSVESCTCSYGTSQVDGCDPDNCEATGGYQKSYLDAWYMSCISLTTVGFGDFAPKSAGGRLFAVFYMTLGIVVVANFQLQVSQFLMTATFKERMLSLNIDDIFDKIDSDGNDEIDFYEFAIFALMESASIDETDLLQLREVFNDFDKDGSNTISRGEVKLQFGDLRKQELAEMSYELSLLPKE